MKAIEVVCFAVMLVAVAVIGVFIGRVLAG